MGSLVVIPGIIEESLRLTEKAVRCFKEETEVSAGLSLKLEAALAARDMALEAMDTFVRATVREMCANGHAGEAAEVVALAAEMRASIMTLGQCLDPAGGEQAGSAASRLTPSHG
jgi:hypothetical protein